MIQNALEGTVTPIKRVVAPYIMKRGRRPVAIFRLSEIPDEEWIRKFKEWAILGHYDPFNFKFSGDEIAIILLSELELEDLAPAVARFINGANIDTGRT